MNKIFSISLVTKIVAITIVLLISTAGITAMVALREVDAQIAEDVLTQQTANLRIASMTFADTVPGFVVDYNQDHSVKRIAIDTIPQFVDHTLIDKVGKLTGNTVTIFAYGNEDDYWRVTTNIIKDNGQRAVGTPLGKKSAAYPFIKEGKTYTGEANILGKDYFTIYQPIFNNSNKVIGIVYSGVEKAKFIQLVSDVQNNIIKIVGSVAAAVVILVLLILRRMLGGLTTITKQIQELAAGNADVVIENTDRGDEIGQIENAMVLLKNTVVMAFQRNEIINEVAMPVIMIDKKSAKIIYSNKSANQFFTKVADAMGIKGDVVGNSIDILSRGKEKLSLVMHDLKRLPYDERMVIGSEIIDLRISAIINKNGEYLAPVVTVKNVTQRERLAGDFDASIKGLIAKLGGGLMAVREEMNKVAAITDENSHTATTVASAAEQSGVSVQSVASAVEELSSSIQEISGQVNRSVILTKNAVGISEVSKSRADDLHAASERIGEIVGMISDIAEQTNLLALNATIEAARAGEAGKGFAVVATEVKNLAIKTASATQDVEAEIGNVRNAVSQVLEAINNTTKTIEEINAIFTSVSASVEEQSAATNEINRNIQQAAMGTRDVVSNIHSVTDSSSKTGKAMAEMLSMASELTGESKKLDEVATTFLTKIRH